MPRSSRASSRPSAPSSRMPSGSRGASTQAYHPPPQQHQPQPSYQHPPPTAAPATGGGGGLFANMASTAAGVAVGSTIGHTVSNALFGGGGSASEPAPQQQEQQQAPAPWASDYNAQNATRGAACEAQSKDLLRCFEATNNDTNACSYYLEQLKACSAAAQSFA